MKFDWHNIWQKKGMTNSKDLYFINGYENTVFSPKDAVRFIIDMSSIESDSSVLEVGCGSGLLAQYFNLDYTGIDYSENMIKKIKSITGKNAYVAEASKLPFQDNFFDHVFALGVFHYFPDMNYVNQVISEMSRVARKSIFIGDLPMISHDKNHLLFKKSMFDDWLVTPGLYNKDRFNISKRIKNNE